MRLGDILLKAGLISRAQLDVALHTQKHTRQRLGQALAAMGACTQEQIDQAWMDVIVRPALEAALDRASFNGYSCRPDRKITFTQARRRSIIVEDMLSGSVEVESEVSIEGVATVCVGLDETLTLHFTHDPMLSFAELQDDDDDRIRAWLGMGGVGGVGGASANIAERVAKAAALLRESNAASTPIISESAESRRAA